MSKMGQELDKRLIEYGHELLAAARGLHPCMRPLRGETPYEWAVSERTMAVMRKVLSKIDGGE